jgi:hypothetical protein
MSSKYFHKNAEKFAFSKKSQQLLSLSSNFRENAQMNIFVSILTKLSFVFVFVF